MTVADIIALGKQYGLRCHHDDDPDEFNSETLLFWHDADSVPEAGLLIQIEDGQPQLADLKSWGIPRTSSICQRLNGGCLDVLMALRDYALQASVKLQPKLVELASQPSALPEPRSRERRLTPRRQRKVGEFKAIDSLGRIYYIEVYREVISSSRRLGEQRLVTWEGESVDRLAKGKYRLVQARIDLSSDDPGAP